MPVRNQASHRAMLEAGKAWKEIEASGGKPTGSEWTTIIGPGLVEALPELFPTGALPCGDNRGRTRRSRASSFRRWFHAVATLSRTQVRPCGLPSRRTSADGAGISALPLRSCIGARVGRGRDPRPLRLTSDGRCLKAHWGATPGIHVCQHLRGWTRK